MNSFYKAFKDKTIVIPTIQREYVQPLSETVLAGFVDTLIKAYTVNDESEITKSHKDLNYIYGIGNIQDEEFEPIDGQQRLTTLWLIHLLIASRNGISLPISLDYQTREASSNFCKVLATNAEEVLATDKIPSKEILDAKWFIGLWEHDITVASILKALDMIHEKINRTMVPVELIWNNMTNSNVVSFAFHSTVDLGDDVYVKMNSRGKPLSSFENLKSWLDDKLVSLIDRGFSFKEYDDDFLSSWRQNIDNDWMELFWRNRNKNDVFPEEIDDEQLRLFYNIAYFTWAIKNPKERREMISNPDDIKELMALLKSDEDSLVSIILSKVRRSNVDLPLFILDKVDLFNEEFFGNAFTILNGLISYEKQINECVQINPKQDVINEVCEKINFWAYPETKRPISFMCQLLMSESNEYVDYNKMALAAALSYYASNSYNKASIVEWMRCARNIIYNSDVNGDSIHNILKALKKWSLQCKNLSINELIKHFSNETGIDQKQIYEEKEKIVLKENYDGALIKTINSLENHNFFMGRIQYLVKLAESEFSEDFKENFASKFIKFADLLNNLFGDNGPKFDGNQDKYLIHRAILSLSNYYGMGYEYGGKGKWCLLKSKQDWKKYLEDFEFDNQSEPAPHNIGLTRLLTRLKNLENINGEYLKSLIDVNKQEVTDWRYYLIEYPSMWNYMGYNIIQFKSNANVLLLRGVNCGKNIRQAELRSRALYHRLKKDGYEDVSLWEMRYWEYDRCCVFFEKENEGEILVMDIYLNIDKTEEAKNDFFTVELFVREKNRTSEQLSEINGKIWNSVEDVLSHTPRINEKGRRKIDELTTEETICLIKSVVSNF